MVFLNKRKSPRTGHDHTFNIQNVGADLQRRVCGECGHVSINLGESASIRSEIEVGSAGLFGTAPESVYELAEALALIPHFGERRRSGSR